MNNYTCLGLEPDASWDDVKKAYRTLVKKYHPDMDGGDRKKFDEVTKAYRALNTPSVPVVSRRVPKSYLVHHSLFKFTVITAG